ncbi:MFS general substrate transporter [Xylariaceae sp. FL1651]|nr:MFS general substrate transporter [Xylariaceae sp. FL1651]
MTGQLAGNERYHDNDNAETTEQTPLVPKGPNPGSVHASASGNRERADSIASLASAVPKVRRPGTIVSILCGIILVAASQGGFQNIPMTRIFEDILCRQYYDQIRSRDEPIDEEMCKVDAIQSQLAYLFAIMASLNAGISCLAALPWGIAADRIGRRPIFAVGLVGMSLAILWIIIVGWFHHTLSPRLIWLSPVFYLLGGGNPVLSATVTSMMTDVVPESERSINFMRINAASMVGNLISPALASIMMASTGPWPPFFVSFLFNILPAFAIFLVPESLKHKLETSDDEPSSISFKKRFMQGLIELKRSATIFNSPSMALVLLIAMLQLSLALCTYQFLSQFASKRYHIPLADTGYIQSTYGAAYIIIAVFIIPFLTSAIIRPGVPSFLRIGDNNRRDLFFARSAYLVSMVATLILGLAPSLPTFVFGLIILAFGVAGESFLRGIATLYVGPEQRSRLFTILGLSAIASDLWVSPVLAGLFSLGMRLGGAWIGLPYFGISGLCVIMFVSALFIKLPVGSHANEESDSNDRSNTEHDGNVS